MSGKAASTQPHSRANAIDDDPAVLKANALLAAASRNQNEHHADATKASLLQDTNDDDENDSPAGRDNEPLLSSLVQKSVKVGPFAIKYANNSPKYKTYDEQDNDPDSFHDFSKSNNDPDLYNGEDDDDEGDDGYYNQSGQHHQSISKYILHKLQTSPTYKHYCLPLRILLLAIYLAFTLSSFWILDSIKEPTLAILVDGQLGKHQPRAKMVSFVVVIGVALGMEYVGRVKQRRRRMRLQQQSLINPQTNGIGGNENDVNAEIEQSWRDRNLPPSMQSTTPSGRLKKMAVRTSNFFAKHLHWRHSSQDNHNTQDGSSSSSKITTVAFYIVGSLYIHFFIVVALALRQHPSFCPNSIFHDANEVAELEVGGIDAYPSSDFNTSNHNMNDNATDGSNRSDWYYPALGYALFALIESYGSVSITIFWAFANSHLTLEAAERHYGSIVALAQAGAIAGSTLSAVLGRRGGNGGDDAEGGSDSTDENDAQVTPLLIFWACGCIGCGMAIMAMYAQLFARPMRQTIVGGGVHQHDIIRSEEEEEGGETIILQSKPRYEEKDMTEDGSGSIFSDLFGGVHMIFRHEYLTLVLAVSVLYEIALTCMHYEMNLIGLDRFGVGISIMDESDVNEEHTTNSESGSSSSSGGGITYIQFMGWYGQTVNILSLFLSFYAFPRLIKHYGLRLTIRIFPTVLLLVTIFAFVLFPQNLYFLFISLSICKALTYSVHDPSEEVLYMPTSDDAKFRAKFWIDVVGQRIAKAVGSAINNYAGSVEGIVKYGSLPSVVASLALWLACYQVGILFDGLIKSGNIVGLKEEDAEEMAEQCNEEEGLELCEEVVREVDNEDMNIAEKEIESEATDFERN